MNLEVGRVEGRIGIEKVDRRCLSHGEDLRIWCKPERWKRRLFLKELIQFPLFSIKKKIVLAGMFGHVAKFGWMKGMNGRGSLRGRSEWNQRFGPNVYAITTLKIVFVNYKKSYLYIVMVNFFFSSKIVSSSRKGCSNWQ